MHNYNRSAPNLQPPTPKNVPIFGISLFRANNDHKLYDVVDGQLENTGGQDMTRGDVVPMPGITLLDLFKVLQEGKYNYLAGLPIDGDYQPRPLTTEKKLNAGSRAIARSLRCLAIDFSTGFALVTIDIDSTQEHQREELERDLFRVIPQLAHTTHTISYSSSAGLFKNGQLAKQKDGRHIAFVVKCASQAEFDEFKANLRRRTWLAGVARFDLSTPNKNTGRSAALERSCIDFATFQAAQPVFERGAELTPAAKSAGFYQQRPQPEFVQGQFEYIDVADFRLTPEQIGQADKLKAEAKAAITGIQTEQQTMTLIKGGKAPEEVQEIVKQSIAAENGGCLEPDFLLYPADDSAPIKAGDLTKDHDGLLLKSVLEPDYRGGAQTAKVWLSKNGSLTITDLAHGTCKKYSIRPKTRFEMTADERRAERLLQWAKDRDFTPDQVIDSEYLPTIPIGMDVAIRSGMGTGKTQALAGLLSVWTGGVALVGSRNSLLLQTAERINLLAPDNSHRVTHIHDGVDSADLLAGEGRVALCFDSLLRLSELYFSDKLVAIDEACAGSLHALIGSTIEPRRGAILRHFEKLIRNAAQVVLLDGNLSDRVCRWIEGIRGKRLYRILNKRQKAILDVRMLVPEKMRDKSFLQFQAIQSLQTGHRIAYVSDSRIECEAIDRKASDLGFRTFRIDSHTMSESDFKSLVRNPNLGQWLVDQGIDCVILSPSAESGVDISTIGWFSKGFASFYGAIDTNAQTQILRRVREVTDWQICCTEQSISDDNQIGSIYPNTLLKQRQAEAIFEKEAIINALASETDPDTVLGIVRRLGELQSIINEDPHHRIGVEFQSDRYFEKSRTRDCLINALEASGHRVTIVDAPEDEATKSEIKSIKNEIKEREADQVFNSPEKMTVDQARRVASAFNAPLEKQREAKKILIKHRLPGIADTTLWSVALIYDLLFGDRQMLRRLENYWIATHMETGAKKQARKLASIISGNGYFGDLRANIATIQYLIQIGLFSLIGADEWFSADSPRLTEIFNRANRSRKARTLGIAPYRSETPARWANRILRSWFGCQIKSRKVQDDVREYLYAGIKHSELLPFVGRFLGSEYSDNPLENCEVGDAQTLTQQDFEPRRAKLYYKEQLAADYLRELTELLKLSKIDGTFEADLAVLASEYPSETIEKLRTLVA